MLTNISIYFLIGIILNIIVDLIFDKVENDGHVFEEKDKWDNFTKGLVLILWPIVIVVAIYLIFNKKEND